MNDQQFHNNFFTEESSPVPIIPANDAWEAMQVKLNNQLPQKKKRRMLLWLPPAGCGLLLLLLLGGGYGIWQYRMRESLPQNQDQPDKRSTPVAEKSSLPAPANQVNADDQLLHNDTLVLSGEPKKKTTSLSTTTDNTSQHKHRPNKELAGPTASRPGTPQLLEKEHNGLTAIHPTNALRPSPVAGIRYEASIDIRPARALKPLWLPQGTLSNDSSGNKPAAKYVFAMGLQAEVPVPIYPPDVYFKNAEGKDRFYQPISPGIWVSITRCRHRLTGEIKPFASALLPDKAFETGIVILPDSSTFTGTKKMVKVFGTQFALQYTFRVDKHWWAGFGVDLSKWRKALILAEDPDTLKRSLLYGVHKEEEPRLNSTQSGSTLHLAYESKAWTGTLQVGTPFRPTVQRGAFPVWIRLGVRLRLLQSKQATPETNRPAPETPRPQ